MDIAGHQWTVNDYIRPLFNVTTQYEGLNMCALFVPGGDTATKITDNGIVIYSDGGCRPNPGIGGWGIHGYIYSLEVPKRGLGLSGIVATSEGYLDKTTVKPEQHVTVLSYIDGYGSLIPTATNNIAELTGAIEAVKEVIKAYESHAVGTAVVYSDSKYVIEGITKWVHGWKSRGWCKHDGEDIANENLWRKLDFEVEVAKERGIAIQWGWIKGHNGDVGNETTDILATQGVIVGNKNIEKDDVWYSEPQGYWNNAAEYNRMLSLPKWYFNTHLLEEAKSEDGRWVYYCGNVKDEELTGKRIADASFSIVYLKEQVEEIATVQRYQNAITPMRGSTFVIGRLDQLLMGANLKNIRKNKELFLHKAPGKNHDLMLPKTTTVAAPATDEAEEKKIYNGVLITSELNPPRLAYTLVDSFGVIQDILDAFIKDRNSVCTTDITDILYEMDCSKKVPVCNLRKSITTATRTIEPVVNYRVDGKEGTKTLSLAFAIDIMNRNDLSALSSRQPKVWVVTWQESPEAFRYATIIEAGDDIGIWAGIYWNIALLSQ